MKRRRYVERGIAFCNTVVGRKDPRGNSSPCSWMVCCRFLQEFESVFQEQKGLPPPRQLDLNYTEGRGTTHQIEAIPLLTPAKERNWKDSPWVVAHGGDQPSHRLSQPFTTYDTEYTTPQWSPLQSPQTDLLVAWGTKPRLSQSFSRSRQALRAKASPETIRTLPRTRMEVRYGMTY